MLHQIFYYWPPSQNILRSHFYSENWFDAQDALQWEWGNFPFANCDGICWGLLLQLVQFIKIHFLPQLESFMWKRIVENKFFEKYPIQPPNGVLPICKLPFPNGSYCNGVFKALWTLSVLKQNKNFCFFFFLAGQFPIIEAVVVNVQSNVAKHIRSVASSVQASFPAH